MGVSATLTLPTVLQYTWIQSHYTLHLKHTQSFSQVSDISVQLREESVSKINLENMLGGGNDWLVISPGEKRVPPLRDFAPSCMQSGVSGCLTIYWAPFPLP